MFVPCTARRSINSQHYALNCITHLFNIQARTFLPKRVGACILNKGAI
jgi:hypothetical protein